MQEEAIACGGCGKPLDETTGPDQQGEWEAEQIICWSCVAKEHAAKAWAEGSNGETGGDPAGVMWATSRYRGEDPP